MILLLAQKGGACFSKGKQGDSTPGTRPHKRGLMQLGHKATNTWSSYFSVLVLVNPYNNKKKSLSPKIWSWLWILDRLDWVGHINYFSPFYLIWSHALCYFPNWHVFFFFITSTNVIFGFPLAIFVPQSWSTIRLTLFYWFITRSPLNMTKPSQVIFPHLFIRRSYRCL